MSRINECHRTLVNGVGKCSVPMWCMGIPAGFCDSPAYGPKVKDTVNGRYVPALACPAHGGPLTLEIHILFDGPPGPEPGRFVEVEDATGKSISVDRWEKHGDYWHLIIPAPDRKEAPDAELL